MFIDTSSYKSLLLYLQQYSGFYYRDYTDLLCDRTQLKYIPTGTCLPFSKKMFVTVNGKILPCERIGHQYGLGHLTTTGIELDVVEIARKYNQYYLKSATKPLKVLIAFTRPLITEFADNLNLKHPLLPTISPYPTM